MASKTVRESVWDYPRPPRAEASTAEISVVYAGVEVAHSTRTIRVLETSHPPVYYIPSEDFREDLLRPVSGSTHCEWKGAASYFDLTVDGKTASRAVWCYRSPTKPFASIAGWYAVYPSRMDSCSVNGELIQPQEGDFYGGWITSDIEGPFKGAPGTWGW